jgi:hypothetical protein
MSPQHQHHLAKFIKCSLIKANGNEILQENLETSKVAEIARVGMKQKNWK